MQQLKGSNPTEVLKALMDPLKPGELGVLMAGAGIGKTACLTLIALEHLLQSQTVLHVGIDELPEKIKVWYHEMLKNVASAQSGADFNRLQYQTEPLRTILTYRQQTFNPGKLEQSLKDLKEQAKFTPTMVVIDGLNFDQVSRPMLEQLQELAARESLSLWMSARTHRHIATENARGVPYPCNESDDLFHAIILLQPIPDAIQVRVLKHEGRYQPEHPEVLLNPETYLLKGK